MECDAQCPYCGEAVNVWVDSDGGSHQSYVEDCAVCCRPWQVTVEAIGGEVSVQLSRLDE